MVFFTRIWMPGIRFRVSGRPRTICSWRLLRAFAESLLPGGHSNHSRDLADGGLCSNANRWGSLGGCRQTRNIDRLRARDFSARQPGWDAVVLRSVVRGRNELSPDADAPTPADDMPASALPVGIDWEAPRRFSRLVLTEWRGFRGNRGLQVAQRGLLAAINDRVGIGVGVGPRNGVVPQLRFEGFRVIGTGNSTVSCGRSLPYPVAFAGSRRSRRLSSSGPCRELIRVGTSICDGSTAQCLRLILFAYLVTLMCAYLVYKACRAVPTTTMSSRGKFKLQKLPLERGKLGPDLTTPAGSRGDSLCQNYAGMWQADISLRDWHVYGPKAVARQCARRRSSNEIGPRRFRIPKHDGRPDPN